jgi:hypothetical protein
MDEEKRSSDKKLEWQKMPIANKRHIYFHRPNPSTSSSAGHPAGLRQFRPSDRNAQVIGRWEPGPICAQDPWPIYLDATPPLHRKLQLTTILHTLEHCSEPFSAAESLLNHFLVVSSLLLPVET